MIRFSGRVCYLPLLVSVEMLARDNMWWLHTHKMALKWTKETWIRETIVLSNYNNYVNFTVSLNCFTGLVFNILDKVRGLLYAVQPAEQGSAGWTLCSRQKIFNNFSYFHFSFPPQTASWLRSWCLLGSYMFIKISKTDFVWN